MDQISILNWSYGRLSYDLISKDTQGNQNIWFLSSQKISIIF